MRLLWESGTELATWRAARFALARGTGNFGEPEIVGNASLLRDWRSLSTCAHDAAGLLARWPGRLNRRSTWLPVGVPGGVEDIPLTAWQAEERGYVHKLDGRLSLTQSARWLGDRQQLVSASVAALAAAVIELVRSTLPKNQLSLLRPLLTPIAAVTRFAAAPAGYRDPDPSSWPIPFLTFAASCIRVIADIQSARRGAGVVPLLDTDELYESWLAVQALDALDQHLGRQIPPTSDALGAWERDDIRYELWIKPGISRDGRVFGCAKYLATVAELLTPDLVVSASRDAETALYILDAKSWAQMLPEEALAQSAKYLYGLRRDSDRQSVPAICGVELVTCAHPPRITDSSLTKIHVTSATPTVGIAALKNRVTTIVKALADEVETRERLASSY